MVYGDTGRYELQIISVLWCVKYLLMLLNMCNDKYACKQEYIISYKFLM